MKKNDDELMTTDEAAHFLGHTAGQLGAWRRHGAGPRYLKIAGWAVRYRRADLIDFNTHKSVQVVEPKRASA